MGNSPSLAFLLPAQPPAPAGLAPPEASRARHEPLPGPQAVDSLAGSSSAPRLAAAALLGAAALGACRRSAIVRAATRRRRVDGGGDTAVLERPAGAPSAAPQGFVTGVYEIKKTVAVGPEVKLGEVLRRLEKGQLVEVLEVQEVAEEQRIRGRLLSGGWITMMNTADGSRWVTQASQARQARPGRPVNNDELNAIFTEKQRFGATYNIDERTGEKKLFAGGLIGGQSAFKSSEIPDYNFDPLGLSEKFPGMLPWFREAELKHGRVAMLAFVGLLGPQFTQMPLLPEGCNAAGTLEGGEMRILEAHNMCAADRMPFIDISPLMIVLLAAGAIEIVTTVLKATQEGWGLTLENAGDYPGRVELGAKLKQLPKDEKAMALIKLQELKNGRLAMMGFSGAITQAALTGHGFPWLY